MADDTRLVCVRRVPHPIEANLLRGLLEASDLPVSLIGEGLAGAYAGAPRFADVKIMVPAWAKSSAEDVLADYDQRCAAQSQEEWRCGSCGEQNDAGFEICWQCGHAPDDDNKKGDAWRSA